jgi:hypothetical protein
MAAGACTLSVGEVVDRAAISASSAVITVNNKNNNNNNNNNADHQSNAQE